MKKTHRLGHRKWRRKHREKLNNKAKFFCLGVIGSRSFEKRLNEAGLKGAKAGSSLKEAMLLLGETASKCSLSTEELRQVFIGLGGVE